MYSLTINFRGPLEKRKAVLNNLTNEFENDIINRIPGTIIYGDYSIKGFITESETGISETKNTWSQKKVQLYCPYPWWIREKLNMYPPFENSSGNNKRYPGMYPHRYANGLSGAYLINEHFTDSNFLLRIYGPVVNPQVFIGEYPYLIYTILEQGEYLEINSRDQTVIKYLLSGYQANIYHSRAKRKSVFRKIPPGRQIVSWTGKFPLDIVLYEERSEPKW